MDIPTPEYTQSTPPKLLLFSLPSKPLTLPDGLTPPSNTVAAIPFLWEEAPGKPRSTTTSDDTPKPKIVRSLDLPPRLTTLSPNNGNNNVGIDIIIPSPTTVLGGPYDQGPHVSNLALASSEKVVVNSSNNSNSSKSSKGKVRVPLRKLMRKETSPVEFRSWRWDGDIGDVRGDRSPMVRFCSWRWDSFRYTGGGGGGGGGGGDGGGGDGGSFNSGGKIGKVLRRNSFIFHNGSTSGFLASMYGTLKQAMPWKSRR